MIDITSQTNYKLADTTQEVLNLTPTPAGQLAIAKDTHNLFISTGSGWQQVAKTKSYGLQHVINAQHSLNSKPVCEFDSRDMSSIKTRNNRTPEDGESVSKWSSQLSTHKLHAPGGEKAPTYVNSDHNGNSGIKFDQYHELIDDLSNPLLHSTDLTFVVVATPTRNLLGVDQFGNYQGLERKVYYGDGTMYGDGSRTQDQGNVGSNVPYDAGYEDPRGYNYAYNPYNSARLNVGQLYDTVTTDGYSSQFQPYFSMSNSNQHVYVYHTNGQHTNFTISYSHSDSLVTGFTAADGEPGRRTDNWNENFVGRPQIISSRVRERENMQTLVDTRIHTWHPYNYIENADTNRSTRIQHTFNSSRLHPLYGFHFNDGYKTIHHCYIFSEYLTDSELTKLGTQLSSDWNTATFKI